MVVPSYPPGPMPVQLAGAATAAVRGSRELLHHMPAVPSHLMGGTPRGPMQPQQCPQPMYRTAAMGRHSQQVGVICCPFFCLINLERIPVSSGSVSAAEASGCVSRGCEFSRFWRISETILVRCFSLLKIIGSTKKVMKAYGSSTLRRRFDRSNPGSVKVRVARHQATQYSPIYFPREFLLTTKSRAKYLILETMVPRFPPSFFIGGVYRTGTELFYTTFYIKCQR